MRADSQTVRPLSGPLVVLLSLLPVLLALLLTTVSAPAQATSRVAAASESASPSSGPSECPGAAGEHASFDPVVEDDPNAVGTGELDARRLSAEAPDAYDLIVRGGGFGHGIGASQYGMRGAAELGCMHDEILETYFPGVEVAPVDTLVPIRVGLWPSTPDGTPVTVINVANIGAADMPWRLEHDDVLDVLDDDPPAQPVGVTWTVRAEPDGGFTIRDGSAADAAQIWPDVGTAGGQGWRLVAELDGTRAELSSKARSYKRGELEFVSVGSAQMLTVVEVPTIEQYLYGLGEVPSSWPAEALAAQAVAARSYAITAVNGPGRANCGCDLYDTVYDQYYSGASKEDGTYGPAWVAGVDVSAGEVLTYDFDDEEPPVVVRAFYSSSNGGASSAAWDIWGSDPELYPYLGPVNSATWEQVDVSGDTDDNGDPIPDGEVDNPYHRWSSGYTNEDLKVLLGLDEVSTVTVIERAPGGRPCRRLSKANPCAPRDLDGSGEPVPANGVEIRGMLDGQEKVLTYDSEGIRARLGGFPRMLSGLVAFNDDGPPFDPPVVERRRVAGADRIATAVALSKDAWSASPVAVIARSDDPADALAGAGLAGLEHAPLLLTGSSELPEAVADELQRLGVERAVILGGEAAVSADVAAAIQAADVAVERVAGVDRFETAAMIARRIAPDGADRVLVIRGRNAQDPSRAWPDALSVSGLAARMASAETPWPVLAVGEQLPEVTRTTIAYLSPSMVTVVGGTAAVSQQIEDALRAEGHEVDRVGGSDRYGTSREVVALDDTTSRRLLLATGANFPDGLAAGPYAAQTGASLLLVPRTLQGDRSPWLGGQHPDLLRSLGWSASKLTVTGGVAAVADSVVDAVEQALREGVTLTSN